jgi:hypothetical protein
MTDTSLSAAYQHLNTAAVGKATYSYRTVPDLSSKTRSLLDSVCGT